MKSVGSFFVFIFSVSLFAQQQAPQVIQGEFIVRFKSKTNAQNFYQRNGRNLVRPIETKSGLYGKVRAMNSSQQQGIIHTLTANLANVNDIARIEPNYRITVSPVRNEDDLKYNHLHARFYNPYTPRDELFKDLWGIKNEENQGVDINVMDAWNTSNGSRHIVIAVIDTGVDYTHPDLARNIWKNPKEIPGNGIDDDGNGYIDDIHGYDFLNNDAEPLDDHGHGTHCAGTIGAAHNTMGVTGVMGTVKIMALKFLGRNGGSTEGAIRAIEYATENGAHIMSNSWGGGGRSEILLDAIKRAEKEGIIFVSTAGNSHNNNDLYDYYPASYGKEAKNVVVVAAIDKNGSAAYFSSYGRRNVHVAAPGVNILSTIPGGYGQKSGTSMAAPHVSGVIGLLLATNYRRKNKVTAQNVRDWLMNTSTQSKELEALSASGGYVNTLNAMMGKRTKYTKFQGR